MREYNLLGAPNFACTGWVDGGAGSVLGEAPSLRRETQSAGYDLHSRNTDKDAQCQYTAHPAPGRVL